MQTLNDDENYQVIVVGKTLTLLKQDDTILNSMNQSREKSDPHVLNVGDFWMIFKHAMIFCVFNFIFLFRNKKSCFFPNVSFRKYLITAMFKALYQQLQGFLTTAFERHLTTEDFTDIGVKSVPRNLTYHFMLLLFLSNKTSF